MVEKVPALVKVISILFILSAVYTFYYGGLMYYLNMGLLLPLLVFAIGLYVISLSIGLWKGKRWARKATIGITLLGIILALIFINQKNIVSSAISVVVQVAVASYLLFSSKVKEAFK